MKLNFGCGRDITKDFFNVDLIKAEDIDKSFDFDKFPYPLKDNQFEYVLCRNVLEHLSYPKRVLKELRRVCKNKAIIEIIVPYVGSKSAYYALDHKSFFNKTSFLSICKDRYNFNGKVCQKFKMVENKIIPQRYLKWLHPKVLDILSFFLNGIYVEIQTKIQVIKQVAGEKLT